MEIIPSVFIAIIIAAFICEYIDSSLGMGYGTTLTPLLLIAGFLPLQVVPVVLLSEFLTGVIAGVWHHRFGNIRLDFRQDNSLIIRRPKLVYIPKSHDAKVIAILTICGIIGALVAIFFAINIPKIVLKTYIGAMVLAVGIVILLRRNRNFTFSWKRLIVIGLISSFNKGISGGGYGPLITGGQILSGRDSKNAVGSTSFAEGMVCLVAFLAYIAVERDLYWNLAAPLVLGAVLSTPFAALTVKKIKTEKLKVIIGIFISILGILTLVR